MRCSPGPAARAALVCADISHGKELRRIPVYNEVDAEEPPPFTYIRWGSPS